MRREELHRLVNAHGEHFAYVLALEAHGQRLGVEARTAARLAGHFHVGQKAHLDPLQPLAFACLASPPGRIEREAARRIAAHARFGHFGVEPADLVPEPHVGGRAGARRLADRRLVDLQHPPDGFAATNRAAAAQNPRRMMGERQWTGLAPHPRAPLGQKAS